MKKDIQNIDAIIYKLKLASTKVINQKINVIREKIWKKKNSGKVEDKSYIHKPV